MARNFSLMPAGTTGRLLDADAAEPCGLPVTALPLAATPAAESPTAAVAPAAVEAEGCFERTGSINVLIWFFVSGPHKYDIAHRDSNTTGASSCTLFMRNTRLPSAA